MTSTRRTAMYTFGEETANAVSHGVGLLLAGVGTVVLIDRAAATADAWRITAAAIYGATLILLYAASTLYHTLPQAGAKPVLQKLDHVAIYLLIAGTYTPFTLVTLRGGWGWTLFGLVWGLASLGIVFELVFGDRYRKLSLVCYLALGWLAVIAVKPLLQSLAPGGIWLMVTGGVLYSLGAIFYAWRKLPYNHAVWHLFVMAASAAHFFCMLCYVVPIEA
jgi:hemolysin III